MQSLNALRRAVPLLEARLAELEAKIQSGDESAWPVFLATLQTATMLQAQASPGAGGALLTTAELASKLGVAPKTILRRRRRGELKAVVAGRRGRGALRWNAAEGMR
jgi:helix-turn-helix protein